MLTALLLAAWQSSLYTEHPLTKEKIWTQNEVSSRSLTLYSESEKLNIYAWTSPRKAGIGSLMPRGTSDQTRSGRVLGNDYRRTAYDRQESMRFEAAGTYVHISIRVDREGSDVAEHRYYPWYEGLAASIAGTLLGQREMQPASFIADDKKYPALLSQAGEGAIRLDDLAKAGFKTYFDPKTSLIGVRYGKHRFEAQLGSKLFRLGENELYHLEPFRRDGQIYIAFEPVKRLIDKIKPIQLRIDERSQSDLR